MVVADSDLEVIRDRINRETDVKPGGLSVAGQVLAALELNGPIKASALALACERACSVFSLPLDRSATDYADAAMSSSAAPEDVVILGLNSGQHAKAVVFASACQAFAALYRAQNSLRDTGDAAGSDALNTPLTNSLAAMLPLLKASGSAFVEAVSDHRMS